MFSTLLTVALFVAPAIQGVFADFAISSPNLVQCGSSKITWEPTKGPYNLIVVKASDPCGDALVEVGDFHTTSIDWKTSVKAGTQVQLSLVDADDNEAWSKTITVGASNDASCLSAAGTTPASSTPGSAGTGGSTPSTPAGTTPGADSSSSGIAAPVGAANAGTNPFSNGAITASQASTPLLALAGLVTVFALL
ncbi:hypothetical protein GALMADRAFT_67518 [Galerina marginata CBS 339.88]|uniref:Uncharacterized protein n=1 Tax=Galerina marginata (strain CBS 339.88) TaxID=685588 RepID=A0A067T8V7_GALM3|nr:hypothetical protein GALMADRAFT_67518 [Galerina marginata CBS 339.88]